MSEPEKKDKVPAWLQITSAVVAILIAFFTIYKWWDEKKTDANCETLLMKARESISEGRKNTAELLKKNKNEIMENSKKEQSNSEDSDKLYKNRTNFSFEEILSKYQNK